MSWIVTALREIYGLFVDDLWFTLSILVWLALTWFAVVEAPRLHLPSWLPAVVLFGGLAVILLESAIRFARHRTRR
jgi:uncharacterized membrane protein YbhN (UPF0104 family)